MVQFPAAHETRENTAYERPTPFILDGESEAMFVGL